MQLMVLAGDHLVADSAMMLFLFNGQRHRPREDIPRKDDPAIAMFLNQRHRQSKDDHDIVQPSMRFESIIPNLAAWHNDSFLNMPSVDVKV